MFCNNCGEKLEDGVAFCPNCGGKVADVPETPEIDEKTVILGKERQESEQETREEKDEEIPAEEISPTGIVETVSAVAVAEPGKNRKFCPNCGTENSVDDVFCQNCGFFFGNTGADANGGGKMSNKGRKVLKTALPVIAAVACIVLLCIFVPRIMRNAGSKKETSDYLLYIKDNELFMAKGGKYEPVMIGEKYYEDKDVAGIYTYASAYISYSPDNKYIYYPHAYENSSYDLYRKKMNDKKAEEEKIDSDVVYYEIVDNDKILYIKDRDDRKLYLYDKKESVKVASDALWAHVSDDGKYIIWETDDEDDRLYIQDIAMKGDKVKLDSDIGVIYAYSSDLKTIVYEKDDNLYLMKNMEDKEKIASDVEDAYVYDINGNVQIYYVREGDEIQLSAYDLIDDDCLSKDEKMVKPRIEDYQTVTYVDDFFGTREKIETDDAYYDALEEYSEKEDREYIREYLKGEDISDSTTEIYHYDAKSGESNKVFDEFILDEDSLAEDTALLYCWSIDIENLEGMPKLSDFSNMDEYGIEEAAEKALMSNMHLWYIKDGECIEITDIDFEDEDISDISIGANENTHMIYLFYEYYTEDYADYDINIYGYDYMAKDASPELICDDVSYVIDWQTDGVYYMNGDDELYHGDTKIDEDIYIHSVEVQEDGSVLYLTDIDKAEQEGTLKMYKNGDAVKIADDVAAHTYHIFEGGSIAFLADYNFNKYRGDLKVYNGREVIQVDSDVTSIAIY